MAEGSAWSRAYAGLRVSGTIEGLGDPDGFPPLIGFESDASCLRSSSYSKAISGPTILAVDAQATISGSVSIVAAALFAALK
ncbi:hypothetical protein [Streptomyces sp. NBC_00162]|uniref:hypothetical protein n=1 Tax=Streptomyces sp. NBC_00162 TaxID=2903629 RepID=UPI00214CC886|nr:hypothetical protein [Streptomyces sp. NBC_00162]UUU37986.1 hypothetical protein JIW86_03370 [Streptomyces sp. NBC_00162]